MRRLTESAAGQLIAARAFAGGPPGFVGAALDLPGPASPAGTTPGRPVAFGAGREQAQPEGSARRALRHGFLAARADGSVTVSGPPSPGLESCLARMGDDLATLLGIRSGGGAVAGIRVGVEAGLDGGGPLGLNRRWRLAHTLAPVLAAAFANSPSGGGWRSGRAARHRNRPVLPGTADAGPVGIGLVTAIGSESTSTSGARAGEFDQGGSAASAGGSHPSGSRPGGSDSGGSNLVGDGPASRGSGGAALNPCIAELGGIDPRWGREGPGADPRAGWTASVMDATVVGGDRSFRDWTRSDEPPVEDDLRRHLDALRAPVKALGHLELDVADGQEGDGWRVAVAVIATLLDDPVAATAAEAATGHFAYGQGVWERAARDALADAELAAAARECFVAAYAALARRGAPRELRDAVAAYTERYVMRGRCPADDCPYQVG
ncbi:glutamate-cysteine ligase family protein [Actinoplanes sp. NPDC051411]|uniref:glutamate-cysteine ligase family protein n=1 Tax=Actinoplanes sp. NPDC051411 TaxID=3155522 RepID=UPI00342B100A